MPDIRVCYAEIELAMMQPAAVAEADAAVLGAP